MVRTLSYASFVSLAETGTDIIEFAPCVHYCFEVVSTTAKIKFGKGEQSVQITSSRPFSGSR